MSIQSLFLTAAIAFTFISCNQSPNKLVGNWEVRDINTSDTSHNLALAALFITSVIPDHVHISDDSISFQSKNGRVIDVFKYAMSGKDSISIYENDVEKKGCIKIDKDKVLLVFPSVTYLLSKD